MPAKNSAFVDSSYFIALYNNGDALHQKARDAAGRLAASGQNVVTSNYVLLEVLTVLSQRIDRQLAIAAGQNISDATQIEVVHITETLHERSWQIFQSVERKNVSFVDCSIVAVMQYAGIQQLLTFDTTDFRLLRKQFGFSLFL